MKWTKLSILISNEAASAVSNMLEQIDANGIQIQNIDHQIQMTAYFPPKSSVESKIKSLKHQVKGLNQFGLNPGKYQISTSIVDDQQWGIAWEKNYHVTKITRFLTIVPSWQTYHVQMPGEIVLKLDPKRAFGTGIHPTTQLTLQLMEASIHGEEHVLDVGTGSGILSIAAVKLGAKEAKGFDVTDDSITSAKRNVKLNHVSDKVIISTNNLLDHINEHADLIVANMLTKFILPLIPQANKNLKNDGLFIISGIINTDLTTILDQLTENHFQIIEVSSMKDWYGIIAKKIV
ncbi:ribosomal protein L11 methyltransferase [Philodulcilactobacillus myokoensis]|uniref:Ribosomal protein L11 methyltransferase n=1 Tax=Philodulcilactobacillus myokoensis TaxID=2929573 RepID=A0A9W6ESX7_9LACO|nr:50S ribosomal protein L11 methyltransferase [Philodulcilactobacillus myokoensis]GLB46927.1 ribosomal protein L11 methyltransferase [Philodulcilactobacillus myokoensis]